MNKQGKGGKIRTEANSGHEWRQLSDKGMQDLSDNQGAKSVLAVSPAICPGFAAVRNLQNLGFIC